MIIAWLLTHFSLCGQSSFIQQPAQIRRQSAPTDSHVTALYNLQTGFTIKGVALRVVVVGAAGLPMEAFEHLVYEHRDYVTPVRELGDLKSKVTIDTAAEAIDYVHLRTSPSTWFLFGGSPIVEVVPPSIYSTPQSDQF